MTARKPLKPEPVAKQTVCSVCGLDWGKHTKGAAAPTLEVCVELLKNELARRPNFHQQIAGGSVTTYAIPRIQGKAS